MAPRYSFRHPGILGLGFVARFAELFLLVVCSAAAYVQREGLVVPHLGYIGYTLLGVFAYGFLAHVVMNYRADVIQRPLLSLPRMAGCLLGAITFVVMVFFLIKTSTVYSRTWIVLWFVYSLVAIAGFRFWIAVIIRRKLKSGGWRRRVALLGVEDKTREILRIWGENPTRDMECVGIYSAPGEELPADIFRLGLYRGTLKALLSDGKNGVFDELIVTLNLGSLPGAKGLIAEVRNLSVNVYYCLPLPLFGLTTGTVQSLLNVPMVLIMRRPLEGHNLLLKRWLDLALGTALLLPFALLFMVIAPLIKLSSPGPVFFRQPRNGLNGEVFQMLKFRSMRAGEPPRDKDGKEKQASEDDPRITWIGKILRKTSLDETPQFLNVLKGDMSFVGPRPHAISHNNYYERLIDSYTSRHKIRPGLTGWAQLNGWRGETETIDKMAKRVEFDIWYIENWSLWLDIKIILLTPFVVLFQRTAY